MTDFAIHVMLLVLAINLTACDSSNKPTVVVPQEVKAVRHYQLKGKVISIDQRAKMLNVDSEAIPGFMDAMSMPYKVKSEGELGKLHPGDVITADLLVQDEGAWLQNITVTGHSAATQNK
jgi:protein SCO1/2